MKTFCLNCGAENDVMVHHDIMGAHCVCPICEASYPVDDSDRGGEDMLTLNMEHVTYPVRFQTMANKPDHLYIMGNLPDDGEKTVAIIGARICSAYGRYMARVYGQAFGAAGWQVLTDLSLGVSGIAAEAALRAGGKVFAVLGTGVDVCYPPENYELYERIKRHGGMISAYPSGTQPKREFFDERRQILAALADVVVVIEARKRGGSLVTAEIARAAGAEVYACPGRCTDRLSDGTNVMIMKHDAKITVMPEDIIQAHNELPVRFETLQEV